MDITFIPMAHGFVYHAVVLAWASRRVLSWRVSITLDSAFCHAAPRRCYPPRTAGHRQHDQGAEFTSAAFTGLLRDISISRWLASMALLLT